MHAVRLKLTLFLSFAAVAVAIAAGSAWADPPPWAGRGGGEDHWHGDWRDAGRDRHHHDHAERGRQGGRGWHFDDDRRRVAIREYYARAFHRGWCPPGLYRARAGCMPRYRASWAIGLPLPASVMSYPLPPALVVQLGSPPPGYRYVRVASDILMVTAGTDMVVDAINDLGRR